MSAERAEVHASKARQYLDGAVAMSQAASGQYFPVEQLRGYENAILTAATLGAAEASLAIYEQGRLE